MSRSGIHEAAAGDVSASEKAKPQSITVPESCPPVNHTQAETCGQIFAGPADRVTGPAKMSRAGPGAKGS